MKTYIKTHKLHLATLAIALYSLLCFTGGLMAHDIMQKAYHNAYAIFAAPKALSASNAPILDEFEQQVLAEMTTPDHIKMCRLSAEYNVRARNTLSLEHKATVEAAKRTAAMESLVDQQKLIFGKTTKDAESIREESRILITGKVN
jgi:hypothetical protein